MVKNSDCESVLLLGFVFILLEGKISLKMETAALSEQEIVEIRKATKGSKIKAHFNNAGASLPPDVVLETVVDYLTEEAGKGGYETELKYKEQLDNTYNLIARLINADAAEIALVENASSAWLIAFYGIDFKPGDIVVTSEMEYVTNLLGLINARKTKGIEIKVIPNDADGSFSLADLEKAITNRVKLIAVTHIASTAGGVLPVVEIGKIARKHNILYLLDACQSVGQMPVDVQEIGCDMLAVTGRKYLRAPRGTGFLYVKKEIQDQLKPVFIDGHSIQWVSETDFKMLPDARRFELYEKNRALTLGLAKAVEYALEIGIDRIWMRIRYLADLLRNKLKTIEGVNLHDIGSQQCGIVTFSLNGIECQLVKRKLAEKHINVSVGLAKSTLIYMNKNKLESIVRASVHYYNTEDEIHLLCGVLRDIINELS